MSASENTQKLRELFTVTSKQFSLRGILGVTRYEPVYNALMQVQKEHLKMITGIRQTEFMKNGFIVSFAYAYPEGIIENIGLCNEGVFDIDAWNIYAKWYQKLNYTLNETANRIAKKFNGIPLPATSEGISKKVESVKDYFPTTVSHRVHTEQSGIGWRGRNSLIINPVYSCTIRLAGVITSIPLIVTPKLEADCGNCTSCLDVCTFLRHKDKLDDYREQCLAYINWLSLDDEVCGKCIKACVNSPRMNTLESTSELDLSPLFYTKPI